MGDNEILGTELFEFEMPNVNSTETEDLISKDISNKILNEEVDINTMEEDNEILLPNYLIEFHGDGVEEFILNGIQAFIRDEGTIFLYIKMDEELYFCGMVDDTFKRMARYIQNLIIEEDGQIYKDYKVGQELIKIGGDSTEDFSTRILNI